MNSITPIIHQTWKDANLPPLFAGLADTWKEYHPEFQYMLWTDDMNREFIKDNYPDFLSKYDRYPKNIQRVDAFRYCLLNTMGGIYIDLDFECLENIESLLVNQTCVIGKEPLLHAQRFSRDIILCNAFMASAPGDKFINYVCEKVISYPDVSVNTPVDVLNSTGPFILTDSYHDYDNKKEVRILESADLYPITMFETDLVLKQHIPTEIQSRIDNAYAIHYFFGNW